MADIGAYHRRSAPISAFTDVTVQLGGVALAPSSSVRAGNLRTHRADWHAAVAEWGVAALEAVGSTCVRYYEPTQVLLQSCASSFQTHAILALADTASICVRDAPATCVGWPESPKKKTGACPASDALPPRFSPLPAEDGRDSKTLTRHPPHSQVCATGPLAAWPEGLPK